MNNLVYAIKCTGMNGEMNETEPSLFCPIAKYPRGSNEEGKDKNKIKISRWNVMKRNIKKNNWEVNWEEFWNVWNQSLPSLCVHYTLRFKWLESDICRTSYEWKIKNMRANCEMNIESWRVLCWDLCVRYLRFNIYFYFSLLHWWKWIQLVRLCDYNEKTKRFKQLQLHSQLKVKPRVVQCTKFQTPINHSIENWNRSI